MEILKDSRGFTLIEALMSMLVLAIGILAVNSMHVSSIQGNSTASRLTVAGSVGGNSYERLLSLDYDAPALDPAGNPHTQGELAGLVLPNAVTSISWNVTEWTNTDGLDNDGDGITDENDEAGIKAVDLTINYQDQANNKSLTLTFLKSELY